jgi:nitroimidazol reductase NimA-like FMN-containing flavoprotein (pyridoxamine 5'-phosphate oxidase superfamily)
MRKEIYRMDRAEAVALLGRAPAVHVVGTTAEGAPLFRTVNAVVLGGHVAFHGAPVGEKTGAVGRPVVVTAEETIASIPSYFVDPERACPATTYYRSVHVHGVLEAVDDAAEKAHVMAALMDKYQPEGGHVPIDAEHPLYRKALAGLLVARVSLERLDGKSKLGQNRTPPELVRVLEQLWQRGAPGDAVAIESVLRANPPRPSLHFFADRTTFASCALSARRTPRRRRT